MPLPQGKVVMVYMSQLFLVLAEILMDGVLGHTIIGSVEQFVLVIMEAENIFQRVFCLEGKSVIRKNLTMAKGRLTVLV